MVLQENERINEINESLRLIENKNSLTFGTDAYLLSAYLPKRSRSIGIELGCGSGVISLLALSRKKCAHVYGIEVQDSIADIARRNADLNSLFGSFTVVNKDLRDLSLDDIGGGQVDFIFSNPPYMKARAGKLNENDNKSISRHELFGDINDFCKASSRLLKHGGYLYMVYRPDRMIDLLSAMRANKLEPKRLTFIHTNSSTPPSLMLVCARLGGKSGLIIDKPIYIYKDGTKEYTSEFASIYNTCSFDEATK
ncbi:MAG: methyltransferase [Clostridia bacterium]|nr:methyltransferase [Clostridia bacterium]